jgi:hypothetical protein
MAVVAALIGSALVSVTILVALRPWRPDPTPIHAPTGPYVPSGPAGRAVVWAVGDGADGGKGARAVAARILAGRADRLLYLGDVYASTIVGFLLGDGSAKDYRDRYAPLYRALDDRTAPTPGNHEWPQRVAGYEPYWRRVYGTTPPAYYRFRVAGWSVLSLNSEVAHGPGSPQMRWLARQVARPGTCRLAFWHRPRYSLGRHRDGGDVAPLWDALRGHAVLVVNGHDHNLQRFRPVAGITEVVAGAGGHGHYALNGTTGLVFGNDSDYGALRIDLRPGRARLRFVAADGRVLDDSALRCRQAAGRR